MKYWKLRTHGTEKGIAPPLSPFHDNNFDTSVKVKDIFLDYTKHLPKKKQVRLNKRPAKRKPLYTQEEYRVMPLRVFNAAIHFIIMGVIKSKFIVKLPAKKGFIYLQDIMNKKAYYKRYQLDPLEQHRKAYRVEMSFKGSKYDSECTVYLSKKYRDILHSEIAKGNNMLVMKEITLHQVARAIHKSLYPKMELEQIYYIILHGFKYICNGIVNKIDTVVFSTNGPGVGLNQIFFKPAKTNINRLYQYRRKTRFLYKMAPEKYSGFYYAKLSNERFNTFTKTPQPLRLYLYIEEAMIEPHKYPHIIRVKVQKPLFKKYTIFREITYEKNNTEYLWRWNDKRFESVNNTQFRFN